MKQVSIIIHKIFVREFYRANATFFLIVMGIAGGFMRSQDHIVLGELIIGSPVLLLLPFVVWLLYSCLILDFNLRTTRSKENEFAYHYCLFTTHNQWTLAFTTSLLQSITAIFYGIFLVVLSLRNGEFLSLIILISFMLMMVIIISVMLRKALLQPGHENSISSLSSWIARRFTRPALTFSLEWIIRRRPLPVLSAKITGMAVLWATLVLYTTDEYDFRLLGVGIVIASAINLSTFTEWHFFDNVEFNLLRSMPYSLAKRIGMLLLSLSVFLIPETGLMVSLFPVALNVIEVAGAFFVMLSIAFLAYSITYKQSNSPQRLTTFIFFATMLWVVVILAGLSLVLLAIINFVIGVWCWRTGYYTYEYVLKKEQAN